MKELWKQLGRLQSWIDIFIVTILVSVINDAIDMASTIVRRQSNTEAQYREVITGV